MTKKNPPPARLSVDQATEGLKWLAEIFSAPDTYPISIRDIVSLLFDGNSSTTNGFDSPDASNHAISYEYSITLRGSKSDVRLFFRPQEPTGAPTAAASWERGWRTLRALEQRDLVSLDRAEAVSDLFKPDSDQAAFGLCLGIALRPGKKPVIKIYFDAVAKGVDSACRAVQTALDRLGHTASRAWLESTGNLVAHELVPIFSLDLIEGVHARAKVYTTVAAPTIATIEQRAARIPQYRDGSVAALCTALLGSDTRFIPGRTLPLLCWSMTRLNPGHPDDVTLHVPFNRYVHGAASACENLKRIVAPDDIRGVEKFLSRSHRAPSDRDQNPFHWLATKLTATTVAPSIYVSSHELDYFRGV